MLAVISAVSIAGGGNKKAQLGPCVRDCVHTFNPSLSDAVAEEFLAIDIDHQDCVDYCKGVLWDGTCTDSADDCCNVYEQETDPDCQDLPGLNEVCDPVVGCDVGLRCLDIDPLDPNNPYLCKP